MIECIIELKSTSQLWEILDDLKNKNLINAEDFHFSYEPPIHHYDMNYDYTQTRNKRVRFYFKDEKYATYLRLLYT